MSVYGDILNGVRRMLLIEERVLLLQADLAALKPVVNQHGERLSRIEGLIEMAMHGGPRQIE